MKWLGTKHLGMLLLAIWLIATGASAFVQMAFANTGLILSSLAIAAGVLVLLDREIIQDRLEVCPTAQMRQ